MARPRSNRDRYPNGQTKHAQGEYASPAMVRRMLDDARLRCGDPRLGTVLGRMRLAGEINDRQYAAGMRYAEIVGAYDRTMGLPRRQAASPSYQSGRGGGSAGTLDDDRVIELLAHLREIDDGSLKRLARTDPAASRVWRARVAYGEAMQGLSAGEKRVLNAVVIDDQPAPDWAASMLLRHALDGLALRIG